MRRRVLVAGIGNVFRGDDGFGVAVASQLAMRELPSDVQVADFGIRGFDLACALLDDYDATILIDTLARGGAPGALYVLEPDLGAADGESWECAIDAHDLAPTRVLRLVRAMGGDLRRLIVVGCEPDAFGDELDGRPQLSRPVQDAVGGAVELVESILARVLAADDAASPGEPRVDSGHPAS
jgi:hydrogenase maturation protease